MWKIEATYNGSSIRLRQYITNFDILVLVEVNPIPLTHFPIHDKQAIII